MDNHQIEERKQVLKRKALFDILDGTRWLTSAEIDKAGSWKNSGIETAEQMVAAKKLFAIDIDGFRLFPSYQFTQANLPNPAMAEILGIFSGYKPIEIAAWFESTSSMLDGKRPREIIATDPTFVAECAVQHRLGPMHG